jgi:hypothetical protein
MDKVELREVQLNNAPNRPPIPHFWGTSEPPVFDNAIDSKFPQNGGFSGRLGSTSNRYLMVMMIRMIMAMTVLMIMIMTVVMRRLMLS